MGVCEERERLSFPFPAHVVDSVCHLLFFFSLSFSLSLSLPFLLPPSLLPTFYPLPLPPPPFFSSLFLPSLLISSSFSFSLLLSVSPSVSIIFPIGDTVEVLMNRLQQRSGIVFDAPWKEFLWGHMRALGPDITLFYQLVCFHLLFFLSLSSFSLFPIPSSSPSLESTSLLFSLLLLFLFHHRHLLFPPSHFLSPPSVPHPFLFFRASRSFPS